LVPAVRLQQADLHFPSLDMPYLLSATSSSR
jgi:hypothetical protein